MARSSIEGRSPRIKLDSYVHGSKVHILRIIPLLTRDSCLRLMCAGLAPVLDTVQIHEWHRMIANTPRPALGAIVMPLQWWPLRIRWDLQHRCLVTEERIRHKRAIISVVGAVAPSSRPYMSAMNVGPIRQHVDMHITTHECIHAQLPSLTERDLGREETHTGVRIGILLEVPHAILGLCSAYALRDEVGDGVLNHGSVCCPQELRTRGDELGELPVQPLEHGVVLADLAVGIEVYVALYRDGADQIEAAEVKVDEDRVGDQVALRDELRERVVQRRSEDVQARVGLQIAEEPKQVPWDHQRTFHAGNRMLGSYSVFSSAPRKVRVASMRPSMLSARRDELILCDCTQLFGYLWSYVSCWSGREVMPVLAHMKLSQKLAVKLYSCSWVNVASP
jgi:hypothetical protein